MAIANKYKIETESNKIIVADKVSGAESSVFYISILPEVLRRYNKISPFYWTFYGIDINCQENHANEWMKLTECENTSTKIVQYVKINGFDLFDKFRQIMKEEADSLQSYSYELIPKLKTLKRDELISQYHTFMDKMLSGYSCGGVTFLYESVLSERLVESLSKRYQNIPALLSVIFNTNYQSFMSESNKELARISKLDEKNKEDAITNYMSRFYYMDANYCYSIEKTKENIVGKIKALSVPQKAKSTDNNINYKLIDDEKHIVELLKYAEEIRDHRKRFNLIGSYTMSRFMDEVANRNNIDIGLCNRAFWYEYDELVKNNISLLETITNRKHVSCYINNDRTFYINNYVFDEKNFESSKNEIKGTSASGGYIRAVVKVIKGASEFNKLNEGDVLVAQMTRPDFINIMHKAGAIITDEGGLTCHAAIVARELGIPCIVGTKNATRILKDGDLVEVDANKGVVRKLP